MSTAMTEIIERFASLSSDEQQRVLEVLKSKNTSTAAPEKAGRSVLDGFKERGMIGAITNLPADYLTNPKYMEGFGQHAE